MQSSSWKQVAVRLGHFSVHVVRRFLHHRGLLLSAAVAYNVLLSIVPLGALALVTLSHLVEPEDVLRVFSAELEHVLPGRTDHLSEEIAGFIAHREVIGWVSVLMLLFFSSLAFRMLGEAMAAVFSDVRRVADNVRGFWMSAAIPYLFVGFVGAGLLGLTVLSSLVERYEGQQWSVLGLTVSLSIAPRLALYVSGLVGELLLFTSVYLVFPGTGVRFRRALVGGITATVLWEGTRRLLLWYFTHVSTISLVYGSLATVVVVLISAEIATIILLLGAQVIAELEHASLEGRPWYDPPE